MYKEFQGFSLFTEMYEQEIKELVDAGKISKYKYNEVVFSENADIHCLCILIEGSVTSWHIDKNQQKKRTEVFKKGDYFGIECFISGTKSNDSFVADKETHILELSFDNINSFYKKNPKAFSAFLFNLACHLIVNKINMQRFVYCLISDKTLTLRDPVFSKSSRTTTPQSLRYKSIG